MAISEATLVERLGKSDRMVRNYAKTIEQVTGKNPQAGPREYHDWSVAEFDAIVAAGGPKSYERQHAQPVAPQPVYEMATNPGHQLTTQAQPSQPAFTVIDGGRLAPMPVGSMTTAIAQPQALTPIPLVTGQIANTANSAAAATAAARQMVSALRDRLTMGLDAIDQQDLQSRQAITALETELADLETVAAEYQQTARSAQIRENLRAARVGKLTNRLAETGSLAGFQLQPLSS